MATLWDRVVAVSERAAGAGALVSLPTERHVVVDHGIPFIVHVTALQQSKQRARSEAATTFNPFLPPDPDLFVTELAPHHLGVLNKFNVLDHHLLIVTRDYEPQEDLLDIDDFAALLRCMDAMDGLAFYNGGTVAGASQGHKHLQLVPLPLGDGPEPTPVDAVIGRSSTAGSGFDTVPAFPFLHALSRLDGSRLTTDRAERLHDMYRLALRTVGVRDGRDPYNLLLTWRWMMVVPRSDEHWRGVSINALGFAGSLLVRTHAELDEVRELGPVEVLASVVPDGAAT